MNNEVMVNLLYTYIHYFMIYLFQGNICQWGRHTGIKNRQRDSVPSYLSW